MIAVKPIVTVKQKAATPVKVARNHFTAEVGVFILELHQVSREIPYFYYGTGLVILVFSTGCYVVRKVRSF